MEDIIRLRLASYIFRAAPDRLLSIEFSPAEMSISCNQLSRLAASAFSCDQASRLALSTFSCDKPSRLAAITISYDQPSRPAASILSCDQTSRLASSTFNCDQQSMLASSAFSLDQALRLAYLCGVGGVGEQVSTNPTLHVAKTAVMESAWLLVRPDGSDELLENGPT